MAGLPLQQLLILLLPAVGAVFKRIPVITNRAIPFVVGIVAAGINYWTMAGLPTVLPVAVPVVDPTMVEIVRASVDQTTYAFASIWDSLAGLGKAVVVLGGGAVQSYITARFHKSYKRQKNGTAAFWT